MLSKTITTFVQKISYEKKCKDVVSVVCPQSPVPLGGTVLVWTAEKTFFSSLIKKTNKLEQGSLIEGERAQYG